MDSNSDIMNLGFNPVDKVKQGKRITFWSDLFKKYEFGNDDPGMAIEDINLYETLTNKSRRKPTFTIRKRNQVQFGGNGRTESTKSHKVERPRKSKNLKVEIKSNGCKPKELRKRHKTCLNETGKPDKSNNSSYMYNSYVKLSTIERDCVEEPRRRGRLLLNNIYTDRDDTNSYDICESTLNEKQTKTPTEFGNSSTDIHSGKSVQREYRPRRTKGDTIKKIDCKHEKLEDIKPQISCIQEPQRSRYHLRSSGELTPESVAIKLEDVRASTKRVRNNNSIQIKKELYSNQNSKLENFSPCASNLRKVRKRGQPRKKDISVKCELSQENVKTEIKHEVEDASPTTRRGPARAKQVKTKRESSVEIITKNGLKNDVVIVEDASPTKKRSPAHAKQVKTKRESVEIVTENEIVIVEDVSPRKRGCLKNNSTKENPVKGKNKPVKVENTCLQENASPTLRRGRSSNINKLNEANCETSKDHVLKTEIKFENTTSYRKRVRQRSENRRGVDFDSTDPKDNTIVATDRTVKIESPTTKMQKRQRKLDLEANTVYIVHTMYKNDTQQQYPELFQELQRKHISQSFSSKPNANVRWSLRNRSFIEDGQVPTGDVNVLDTKTIVEETLKSDLGYKLYQRYCCQNDPNLDRNTLQFWNNSVKEEVQKLSKMIPIDRLSLYMKSSLLERISQSNIHTNSLHQ